MADDTISSPIEGAEIVSSETNSEPTSQTESVSSTSQPDSFDTETYESVKNLVSRKTSQADELNAKIKELNNSLKNILVNDAELAEAEEQLKEVRKAVTKRKADLNNSPEAQSLKARIKEMKEELKDVEETLSSQLLTLYQLTGVQEFETNTGEVREFVIKAKVKAKKS
ncbi:MAG: hypothetical protein ACOX6V_04180 [Patescibacteria group bacterium]|jgi:DNA repair exonuclease SbcCD ATPase subunit